MKPAFFEDAEYPDGVGLEVLDALGPKDPARDDVCKRLSTADRVRLMARYGRDLHGHPLPTKAAT